MSLQDCFFYYYFGKKVNIISCIYLPATELALTAEPVSASDLAMTAEPVPASESGPTELDQACQAQRCRNRRSSWPSRGGYWEVGWDWSDDGTGYRWCRTCASSSNPAQMEYSRRNRRRQMPLHLDLARPLRRRGNRRLHSYGGKLIDEHEWPYWYSTTTS